MYAQRPRFAFRYASRSPVPFVVAVASRPVVARRPTTDRAVAAYSARSPSVVAVSVAVKVLAAGSHTR